MKYLWASLVALLVFSGLGLTASYEETYSGEVMDGACAKAGSHTPMMKNMGMKTAKECTLACIKMGDKYVLFDKSNKKVYQLDNQSKFEQFAGQKVTVKGTLDAANGTIHVTDIAPASGAEKPKAASHPGL
jgi:hypothetical protein